MRNAAARSNLLVPEVREVMDIRQASDYLGVSGEDDLADVSARSDQRALAQLCRQVLQHDGAERERSLPAERWWCCEPGRPRAPRAE